VSEDTSGQLAYHGRPFLTQLDHSQHVAPPLIGSAVNANVVLFSSDDGPDSKVFFHVPVKVFFHFPDKVFFVGPDKVFFQGVVDHDD
jgi:hypothetical protein